MAYPQTARSDTSTFTGQYSPDYAAPAPAALPASTSTTNGYLTAADWTTFNGKYTPGTDLSAGKAGFNGNTPIAKPALSAAATDPATTMALTNQVRAALISYGLCS